MNVRVRMYQVLLFKFGRHLCKGSMPGKVMANIDIISKYLKIETGSRH